MKENFIKIILQSKALFVLEHGGKKKFEKKLKFVTFTSNFYKKFHLSEKTPLKTMGSF